MLDHGYTAFYRKEIRCLRLNTFRDGSYFRHILNYLREPETFQLPGDFIEYTQLANEAKYYGITGLVSKLTGENSTLDYVEIIEACHPEKVGVCSARIVLSESLKEKSPFAEILEQLPKDHDEYSGLSGRSWIRTETSRLDWGLILKKHGWSFVGYTSFNRRLPDITGQGTDLCHVIEKWIKL